MLSPSERTGCCFLPSRTRSACSRYRTDPYRFSLTATTTLQSSHGSGVKSFLVRDVTTGAITSYSYASRQLTLAAGDWELEVGNYQSAGTYCLTLSRT